ncbi:MAG: hypothetical protein HQ518_03770 [Rhodopirellula sp.]|nr:hypothetical protein [Rhodopirellula sp.]
MSDGSETSPPDDKVTGIPSLLLLSGFLVAATVGSALFVLPGESQTPTVSSALAIPPEDAVNVLPNLSRATDSREAVQTIVPAEATIEPLDPETARLSQLLVGDWRQDFHGERILSIKADGSATMTILPSVFFTVVFGQKIDVTMFWSIKDGHMDYGISGGTPEDKVKMAASTWGDHWVEKIITLDDTKLDLLSVDGTSHSIWERVNPNGPPEAETPTP